MNLKKKVALVILDGYGIGKKDSTDAIYLANPSCINQLMKDYTTIFLHASGKHVGLADNQFGNSETGHLLIGSGRLLTSPNQLINESIQNNELITKLKSINSNRIHLVGMYSKGLVHSNYEHINYLINQLAKDINKTIIVHLIVDGRDSYQYDFINYIDQLEVLINQHDNVYLKSISGRYYAMDRDQRWDRTQLAFNEMFTLENNLVNKQLKDIFNEFKEQEISDEFIKPFSLLSNDQYALKPNDCVLLVNYRADRIMQLTHLIKNQQNYQYINPFNIDQIELTTITQIPKVNSNVLVNKKEIKNSLGDVLRANNIKQARVAETEKYAHVSFFFDGGNYVYYPSKKQFLVPSAKVATYDLKPSMSANLITQTIIDHYDQFDVFVVNYANADMVGHTGNLKATIQSVKSLDDEIKKLYDYFKENNGVLFITADHGNADLMLDDQNQPLTTHSLNQVPFIITDKSVRFKEIINGSIANVAPTLLDYLGLLKPVEMTEDSLIEVCFHK
ncbi:phosphoglyceromutase [Ureaplasma diversum]|uniref:2,3-bisphosphoglycerate-independent phosphoglycerate mutase n=1 Tax=Ureaplasma diversum TaxID=42094 RepID=A0A0C5S1R0_9BACT|nr:2,3-bisphosphoglycerate-independent phosphoglycerate mutase [Ureaplasma diversum]AJQ45310.1 phosphoglyceromutase [Ureaplasma diversum]